MKLTVNTNHLALIDRVVDAGMIGKTREAVLNSAVIEHVRYLLAGGTPFKAWQPGVVEVDTPAYGPVREECGDRANHRQGYPGPYRRSAAHQPSGGRNVCRLQCL